MCSPRLQYRDHIDGVSCKERSPNIAELKEYVNVAWAAMTPSFIKRVSGRFRSRLESVVAARGSHIK